MTKREKVIQFHNDLRATVSFLMSEGHPSAGRYPLGYLFNESRIAERRVNQVLATGSLLMQACIGAALTGKEGAKQYNTMIKRLTDGE